MSAVNIDECLQKLDKEEEWPRHVGKQVLKECKKTDDLKDFLKKPEEAEKPDLFVFRKQKDAADEFWITKEDFKGLSDTDIANAPEDWFPIKVYNKVIDVKEELEKMTETDRGDLKLEKGINGTPEGELVDFFQDPERYAKGALFEAADSEYIVSRHEHNNMARVLCHSKTNIDVWTDAVDLRSSCENKEDQKCKDGCRCFKVLFHYTKKLAFSSITSAHKKFHELRCSYGNRAHFGDGLYASQYAPEHFGSKLRVALNNYGSCDTDPFSERPLCCPKYWEDIRTRWAVEAADFCIPILVPEGLLRNFKDTDRTGKFQEGCNHKGVKQHQNRDVWVVSPPKDKNVMSDTKQRLELLRMRQENEKASDFCKMHAFADAAHILFQQGDLAEAGGKFEEALEIQKKLTTKTKFGPSLVMDYARCLRKQDTYESKQKAKELLETHGVTSDADSGSMLQSLDHASWRHQGLDEHFKAFYDSWKQGDLAVAQNRLDQFESLLKQLPGEQDRDLNTLKTYRAAVFSDQGNLKEAEKLLEGEVLEYRTEKFGADHMETLACRDLLARLFLNWRRFEDAVKHAEEALKGREGPNKSDHLNVLRSRSFLQEILIEKAQWEESSLSGKVFKEAFEIMEECAKKMLPEENLGEANGYTDHRAAFAMWNNAACVARRFAALPNVNEEAKEKMLERADTIYGLLYKASKEPGSWDHAVHHARIASNWARVLDLKSRESEKPEKVLKEAKETVEKFIKTPIEERSADSQSDDSSQDSPAEKPFKDDHLLDQKPSVEDLPLEFLILYNNLAFLKNKRGTARDLEEARVLYSETLELLEGKLALPATQQHNAVQQEAFSAAMTLGEILLKLIDQPEGSDEGRLEKASQNFLFAADGFKKLLGEKNVKSVACRHSYASVRLQQGGRQHWQEAMEEFEAVAASWEEVNMGGAAASMLQESLDLKEEVQPKLLQTLMRARALFSAASAFKAIWLAPEPGKADPTSENLEEICKKFDVVLKMKLAPEPGKADPTSENLEEICEKFDVVLKMKKEAQQMEKDLGKDAEVFKRLKGILAMAHAELGQLHGQEYQKTKDMDKFETTEKHFEAALKWLPEPPADEEVQLLRCRTHFNSACLQLTALQYANECTWEKVSENFRHAADGYGELIESKCGECPCQGAKGECFYYQRANCKFNLIKAISMQRDWQAVKAQHEEFKVLIEDLEGRKEMGCAAAGKKEVEKWKAELVRNLRRSSITKEGSKASQVAAEAP